MSTAVTSFGIDMATSPRFFDILVYVSMAFFILLFFDTDHWGVPDVVFVASVCNRFAALGFNAVVA